MTIGTLYIMFNNLNNLTHVVVNEIQESETQPYPVNVVVFSDRFMNMPLKVLKMRITDFTYIESTDTLVIDLQRGNYHEKEGLFIMTLYHLYCISPFIILCVIGAAVFIYGFLKGWWYL